MARDPTNHLISRAMDVPLLSAEQEYELGQRIQSSQGADKMAIESLIRPHLRLVVSIANTFKNYGLPIQDLIQEGVLGLMHAADRFRPERRVRFATYSQWWIRSYMTEYVLRNWSLIRLGSTRTQKFLFFNLRRLRNNIEGIEADGLSDEAIRIISEQQRISENDVRSMEQRLGARDSSIHPITHDDGSEERATELTDEGPNPEHQVLDHEIIERQLDLLDKALKTLTQRERDIILMRRLREEPMTLEEVGVAFSISKERIRQLEHRAMSRIKEYFLANNINADDLFG